LICSVALLCAPMAEMCNTELTSLQILIELHQARARRSNGLDRGLAGDPAEFVEPVSLGPEWRRPAESQASDDPYLPVPSSV
jgi:hypothetical protein